MRSSEPPGPPVSARAGTAGRSRGLPDPRVPGVAFELLAEIATGPTARVELCRVVSPAQIAGKLVAVKRLHPHIAEDPQFASMFVDEVWMTAALDSDNVARVVGWGNDPEGTYLAVELVEGVSLARLMKTVFETGEAFTERMVVFLGSEICAGLSAAHALTAPNGEHLRLVHRDLTPGNVLLGFDGAVKIADFGLAKAKQRVTKTLTGLLKGHPHYMAPEQARQGELDGRADLFSLGVVLFELFTGRHPWEGATELEVFRVMGSEPPTDILSLRPKLDKELAFVVSRLLERDLARRFRAASEVRERLELWLYSHGYKDDGRDSLARFVRRNAMRQMRWFERAVAGEFLAEAQRAKTRGAPPQRASGPARGGTQLTSRTAATVSPGRRRFRRERDEVADTEKAPAQAEPFPDAGQDWGEEHVPTEVKPHGGRDAARAHVRAEPPLPSFADEEDDSEGDQRMTAVKRKAGDPMGVVPLPPPRIDVVAGPEGEPIVQADTIVMPMVDLDTDETDPVQFKAPKAPDSVTPRRRERPRELRDTARSAAGPSPERSRTEAAPPAPAPPPKSTRRSAISSEADVRAEAARLSREADRLANVAEQAAKVAAHRSVIAQLAAEAAELAENAAEVAATSGLARAAALLGEAHRLEDTVERAEATPVGGLAAHEPPPRVRSSGRPPRGDADGAGASYPPSVNAATPGQVSGPGKHGGSPVGRAPVAPEDRPFKEDLRLLVGAEVHGMPVPIALGVAFAVALALVVLVALLLQ